MNRRNHLKLLFGLAAQPSRTRNLIVFMADGLRWQEVFQGVDAALMNKESGVSNLPELQKLFARPTREQSRAALLPFLWSVVARRGQVFGNRALGSDVRVTNGFNFSYPGYSETFCGFGDPRVDSNDKKYNPNLNVLEWLNRKPGYAGKVAAFGAWELFPYILNAPRAGIVVNAGYEPLLQPPVTGPMALLNRLKRETAFWEGEAFDAPTFLTALEYFKQHKPRVLFVSLGETDEWAHHGRYDLYLKAANLFDRYAGELWQTAQSMPEYRGSTSLVLAVDHGRGDAPKGWESHGQKFPDSQYTWMACMGPDTRPLGERRRVPAVTQSQIAATLAALLGEDFTADAPRAAKPVSELLPG